MSRKISYIIVHCSDSDWGDAQVIDKWHKANGWRGIGYHYVIMNGRRTPHYEEEIYDGILEDGREIKDPGAHAVGYNSNSIGICLIGRAEFTTAQLHSLLILLVKLIDTYEIKIDNILGHYETENANGKTCPNFDMKIIRKILKQCYKIGELKIPKNKKSFNFK